MRVTGRQESVVGAPTALRARAARTLRSTRGITGIETAIILIAFVVVASVFAYAVLSAGIFSPQRGKDAVLTGIDRAASSIELIGSMKADGVAATVLTTADSAANWTASGSVTLATETDDRKEGTCTGLSAAIDPGAVVLLVDLIEGPRRSRGCTWPSPASYRPRGSRSSHRPTATATACCPTNRARPIYS